MNTPNRPHEELDADERELARVVRALPGNEPSPALDLRILKSAQDAVATPAKRTRRALWAASSASSFWGFGTAAAAVLAVGVSWQLFMRAPSVDNMPSSGPAVIAENSAQDRDATSVDFIPGKPATAKDESGQFAGAPAPASQPMLQAQRAVTAEAPMRQESKALADAPKPFIDEHVAAAAEKQSEVDAMKSSADTRADAAEVGSAIASNRPAENAASASAAPVAAMAPAPAPMQAPAAPPPMDSERRERTALAKTAAATGMLAGGAAPADQAAASSGAASPESPEDARHRVRLDARLYPESWILKIRSRLKHGDTLGARASLRLFVERYPHETVPDNLQPLLDK